ncbi:hypothetical protein ARAM_004383 [Aspergillus rambellii]|uniref:Shugoshin n=1 Tax=Aspergillus rambellii TaxID=308745 RepID=A0A0F8UY13_9EURO|nr:hypothetical protein ARAM_004383 [Aspergillus rambellii]
MARLNESTSSAESIEILKRRFVRQNREIARVNSIQSLRIRSLESEVSHLLAENVSLREQLISLSQELERFEAARTLQDGVYDVKSRLDSKLVELGNLVAELGSLPRQFSKTCREKSESTSQVPPRRPDLSLRPNAADSEWNPNVEADGRLPIILEDKYYPRRTLEPQEIEQFVNHDTKIPSSPGLEDISISPKPSPEDISLPANHEEAEDDIQKLGYDVGDEHVLPPTLETRRKKRTEPATVDKVQADPVSPSLPDVNFTQKCGAKRKFSVEDEQSFEPVPAEDDGFEFSRPVHSPLNISSSVDHSPVKRKPQSSVRSISLGQPKRKVLEPKNTNLSVSSPAKSRAIKGYNRYQNNAANDARENLQPKEDKGNKLRERDISPIKPSVPLHSYEQEADNTGAHDAGQESATAPTPPVRPSRRQRAIVSYAEPNLRDKMRRSTNELVAAVGVDKPRKSTSYTVHTDTAKESDEQRSSIGAWDVAEEKHTLAPLETLSSHAKRQMNMISQRKRKTSPIDKASQASDGAYIEDATEDQTQFSSAETDKNEKKTITKQEEASIKVDPAVSGTTRQSRRHSSNIKSSERNRPLEINTELEGSASFQAGVANLISEITTNSTRSKEDFEGDSPDHGDIFTIEAKQIRRGQRAAARRRSMML